MAQTIAHRLIENLIKEVFPQIFEHKGIVYLRAATSLVEAMIRKESTLVADLAMEMMNSEISFKGMQERISGWLERYDYVNPIAQFLWRDGASYVHQDTFIAVDQSDISKEFGGRGMEGMAFGRDGSRNGIAMGHTLLAATVVHPHDAVPLSLKLLKGRSGHAKETYQLVEEIAEKTDRKGIIVCDRGFDSENFIHHLYTLDQRAVIRIKETNKRDFFGDGKTLSEAMAIAPYIRTKLHKPQHSVNATVRWRKGQLYVKDTGQYIPVLIVESTFGDKTISLYAVDFVGPHATYSQLQKCAILAAEAYYNRWSIERFFRDFKQQFAIEKARVRTFRRLQNLVALSLLAYHLLAHTLRKSPTILKPIQKLLRENLNQAINSICSLVPSLRKLLQLSNPRHITGRPREKPPDPRQGLLKLTF